MVLSSITGEGSGHYGKFHKNVILFSEAMPSMFVDLSCTNHSIGADQQGFGVFMDPLDVFWGQLFNICTVELVSLCFLIILTLFNSRLKWT
jgi:hypothetical protein